MDAAPPRMVDDEAETEGGVADPTQPKPGPTAAAAAAAALQQRPLSDSNGELQDPVYTPRYRLRVSALFNDGPVLNFSPPVVANLMRHAELVSRESMPGAGTKTSSPPPAAAAQRRVPISDPSAGQNYPRPYAHRLVARLDDASTVAATARPGDIPEAVLAEARVNQCRPRTGPDSVLASAGYVLLAEISEGAYAFSKVVAAVRAVRPRFRDLATAYGAALAADAVRVDGKRPVVSDARLAGDMYALRLIDFHHPAAESKRDYLRRYLREVDLLSLVYHPNIVNVIEVFPTKDHVCVVMEMALTDLDTHARTHGPVPEALAAVYLQQLLYAVDYLHLNHITHRGIRGDKVLLFPNDVAKLSLCGHSRIFTSDSLCSTHLGGSQYVPPECLVNSPYDARPVDVWSLGVIVYFMVCGYLPFEENDPIKMIRDMKERDFRRLRDQLSSRVTRLINCMLDPNPVFRMTMADIQRHSWLTEARQAPQCVSPPCTPRVPASEAFHCFDKCC